jgi:hypothetical protein
VRLSAEKVRKACRSQRTNLSALLAEAGVSRTAYYSLVRRGTVLPTTVIALAEGLGCSPSALLEDLSPQELRARTLLKRLRGILRRHPDADRENVWHTLLLLDEPPIDRLNRGLTRAR